MWDLHIVGSLSGSCPFLHIFLISMLMDAKHKLFVYVSLKSAVIDYMVSIYA